MTRLGSWGKVDARCLKYESDAAELALKKPRVSQMEWSRAIHSRATLYVSRWREAVG